MAARLSRAEDNPREINSGDTTPASRAERYSGSHFSKSVNFSKLTELIGSGFFFCETVRLSSRSIFCVANSAPSQTKIRMPSEATRIGWIRYPTTYI